MFIWIDVVPPASKTTIAINLPIPHVTQLYKPTTPPSMLPKTLSVLVFCLSHAER
jgi:hypothetical protein